MICPEESLAKFMGGTVATEMTTNSPDTHQIVLVLDDDLMVTEGLAAGLSRPGRTIVTCNDLESGELIVEWLKPSHVVSDVRLTGTFGYEGLDFIRFVKRHSPDTRIILMTGDAPDALQLEASERGAVGFLRKPFEIAELDSILDLMAPPRSGSPDWPDVIRVPLLDQILQGNSLSTIFQPIINLASGEQVGYEALARCQSESPLRNPETLFKYAARKHRVSDLEVACIRNTIQGGALLAQAAPLFLNIHPAVFASGRRIHDAVITEAERNGISLNRIVLEITEQGSLTEERKALDAIEQLKKAGVRFAFDDVGVAYSHLPFIGKVRPSFLKISQHFGTGFELDTTKTKIVRNLLSLAIEFECELILEGIESASTATAALELGIKYGQGFYFGQPAEAASFLKAGKAPSPSSSRIEWKG
jgi:EAL domain-containing protein (putative c-di-GMP-specific phosphodiesterase class I)/ActR/RegA family two-component response regulator